MSAEPDLASGGAPATRALGRLRRRAPAAALPAPAWSLHAQLRRRLLSLLVVLWLLAAGATGAGLWARTDEVLDSALKETAERLLMLPEAALATPDTAARQGMLRPHDEFIVYQVQDAQAGLVLRSSSAPPTALDPGAPDGVRPAGDWLVLTLTAQDGRRRAQVAETLAHRHAGMRAGVGWLLGTLLALLPVAWLAMDWLLRRGFDSLEPARRELAQRPLHDLRPLSVQQVPVELQPWLATVNSLLARVAGLIDSERAFAANTAHELRTPLAAARAQAQRLVQASTDDGTRTQAQSLLRQLDRLTGLATRLLQLARVESGVALQREPVDLVQLAVLVVDEFAEATRSGQLQLQVRGPSVPVSGDIDALGIALRNLIDNALKHGGSASQVVVTVAGQQLAVQDDGPGVAPALLPTLVRPFDRGPGHALQGSGLGLAMVDTIARQSGAQLQLQSPVADGRGFAAVLDFGSDTQPG
ncbi:sensor histidine kinase [Pseudaquabacterium pictum]|uniref:histidine kinase n=1 Tax=Pseudaquabacterium pictum TaxID=2315236 RepID=A0A480ATA3_9BURK|nr:ATP-binding protein [Rubrivivax pictus]GCL64929.1 two-component sensor histidine kinase [Rubrivivax pictus]